MSEVVQYILAPDGRSRVSIFQRSDGRYEYSHDKFYVDDSPDMIFTWNTGHRDNRRGFSTVLERRSGRLRSSFLGLPTLMMDWRLA